MAYSLKPHVCCPKPLCDSLQRDIMLVDACPATLHPAACRDVNSGVLTRGLFAAMNDFANLYIELAQSRGLARGNFTVVQVNDL